MCDGGRGGSNIEKTAVRSGRQISNVRSNKYKFIDEEESLGNLKCRSVNTECQLSSAKVLTIKLFQKTKLGTKVPLRVYQILGISNNNY